METAPFTFSKYQIEKFSFNKEHISKDNISINIVPSGILISGENKFILTFNFIAYYESLGLDKSFVECVMCAEFIFASDVTDKDDIPAYFYTNSIAIVFPYLRSFISSLTIQANLKPIILPTMNLTSLSTPLRESVKVK